VAIFPADCADGPADRADFYLGRCLETSEHAQSKNLRDLRGNLRNLREIKPPVAPGTFGQILLPMVIDSANLEKYCFASGVYEGLPSALIVKQEYIATAKWL